jgi:hypothetical protein
MQIFGLTVAGMIHADVRVRDRRLWTGLGTGFARFLKSAGFPKDAGGLPGLADARNGVVRRFCCAAAKAEAWPDG